MLIENVTENLGCTPVRVCEQNILITDTYIYTVYTHKSCNFWSLSYTIDKISIYTSGPGYTTDRTIYPFTN